MAKKRLNITLEPDLIERARRYSERHQTSISHLVGEFLSTLPANDSDVARDLTPTVRRLHGMAKGGPDREDYPRHLLEKHR